VSIKSFAGTVVNLLAAGLTGFSIANSSSDRERVCGLSARRWLCAHPNSTVAIFVPWQRVRSAADCVAAIVLVFLAALVLFYTAGVFARVRSANIPRAASAARDHVCAW